MLHSIGIVAAKKSAPPLIKLSPSILLGDTYPALRLESDGQMRISIDAYGTWGWVTGEWYVPGPTVNISAQYQYRTTIQAGFSLASGHAQNWTNFNQAVIYWGMPNGGRVLLEVRQLADPLIYASAQFWTSGYAP